jgi:uracil-DNA glycosylase family 4
MPVSALTELYEEIANCQRCILSQARKNAVPGEGPEDADIVFIGEGPGFHEDQQGRPFVGAAGQFLDELLESISLRREDVYICNVIKCRPPGNRDPLPEEVEACKPHLDRQIEIIAPKMIVTLGRFSMERYFPGAKISQIHGQARKLQGIIYYPMYHPAAALHQPRWRPVVEEDMSRIPQLLAATDSIAEVELPRDAEQLSLF